MPDIKFGDSLPTDDEKKAVDKAIESYGPATIEVTERLVYAGQLRTQERRHRSAGLRPQLPPDR